MPRSTPPPSAAVYSPLVLAIYDAWVLGVSNTYAWKCSTRGVLLPFFERHIGRRHLDVGVGTGYYLDRARIPSGTHLTLLDSNPNCLAAAQHRLGRRALSLMHHDVTDDLSAKIGSKFDSISLFYLLHCLSGDVRDKAAAIANLARYLKQDGVLYGATILGPGDAHNLFGRCLMRLYNQRGIFGNRTDTADALKDVLDRHFDDVRLRQHGAVALFEARRPRAEVLRHHEMYPPTLSPETDTSHVE